MSDRAWIRESVGAEAFERLAEGLAGSELQSLLLEVMRRRAARRAPADVVAQHQRDPFCRPGVVDQRESVAIDARLLAAAEGFEAIELSPVAPLGGCEAKERRIRCHGRGRAAHRVPFPRRVTSAARCVGQTAHSEIV